MSITSYNTDFQLKHSFFGKARLASIEPFANFCHKVVEDRNYTEDEHAQLIGIVHSAICAFFKKYPKTRARIMCIQLDVGSSLKSLRFIAEGYDSVGSAGALWSSTGDRFAAETELFRQEFRQQYIKDTTIKIDSEEGK